ncbi:hypothetical protein DKG34_10230 [Streptomyces sp. NWU49]|uniref:hypothetical protein n=1 Tax=Streptomyces sp. NWU49 TaxID=2201153 RepID=UPI000D67589D|nr:hypothetical protein [Streptomyces sp. NWU49]PWJ07792.1 hypothetical protein DKG34_10230 [Streptomyces sp. NWU49]
MRAFPAVWSRSSAAVGSAEPEAAATSLSAWCSSSGVASAKVDASRRLAGLDTVRVSASGSVRARRAGTDVGEGEGLTP